MPLAERGLIFEERTPPARSHPNRTDIACFVGEVALRDGSAPAGDDGVGFVIYLRNRGFAESVGRAPIILD